jgi:proline-rich tail region repeat protein
MTSKTIAFKQPQALARPAEDWVGARSAPTAPAGPTKRLTVDVPAELHKRIKIHCATAERQISDIVRELLEEKYPAA